MQRTDAERAARKQAQKARVAAKGTPQYPYLYAQQPEQIRLAETQTASRLAQKAAKDAASSVQIQDALASVKTFAITGDGK